uniref:beta-1,3-galactosyltransferase 1-like isoform X2 n=2 Tax=Scatophagus argus TaxID=75038 RepID=UPI001ED83F09|nr:beta-1,3-galactosyltransferase 1-like isoform X2 [Scatophagus argus]XP_046252483.1 beta-1,3-galactosyltransferase 1-like isoform X2 [Scatophagus argus]
MPKSDFAEGGQRQRVVVGEELADSRRACSWSRRRCLFIILVFGAVLFVSNVDIKEMVPGYNQKWRYNATKWWPPFREQEQNAFSPNVTDSSISTVETSTSAFPHTETIMSTNLKDTTQTSHQTTDASLLTTNASLLVQQTTAPPSPVPYKSPGPYLVEYPYDYHFIINEPQKCEQQKPFLVLMVPVAPHNRKHRDIVRSTWGGESPVLDKVVMLFFLLGLHTGEGAEQLQDQLLQESKEHQDLIQSDFLDCYKNLTIKTMVMLEWLDFHCSSASYAMKIDSDMFLNVPNLINMLLNAPKTNYMTGLVARGGAVLRDKSHKWYVPVELYPHPQYPRYALGLGYVLSLDLPKKLVEASRHVKPLYIEDVYLGLCMQHLGIPPTDPPNWGYFNVFPVGYSRCAYSRLIATTTHENSDRLSNWKDFKKPGPYC